MVLIVPWHRDNIYLKVQGVHGIPRINWRGMRHKHQVIKVPLPNRYLGSTASLGFLQPWPHMNREGKATHNGFWLMSASSAPTSATIQLVKACKRAWLIAGIK
jgi:hypothetical protein